MAGIKAIDEHVESMLDTHALANHSREVASDLIDRNAEVMQGPAQVADLVQNERFAVVHGLKDGAFFGHG